MWAYGIYLFYEDIYTILVIICFLAMITSFIIYSINYFVQSPLLATIGDFFFQVMMLRDQILHFVILKIFREVYNAYVALFATSEGVSVLLEILFNMFASKAPDYRPQSLDEMCDYTMVRLEGIDEASAHQKRDILKALHAQVQEERVQDPGRPLKDLLDKKYPVSYLGRDHQVSFTEVASTSRPHGSAFCLDPQPAGMMGFFKRQTTTEQLLSSVQPAMAPGI
ncbi:MAG TPA: hypothetical protein DDY37_03375 [Legionella sp.]|nr:hypothetical protein [Legionella sp.]